MHTHMHTSTVAPQSLRTSYKSPRCKLTNVQMHVLSLTHTRVHMRVHTLTHTHTCMHYSSPSVSGTGHKILQIANSYALVLSIAAHAHWASNFLFLGQGLVRWMGVKSAYCSLRGHWFRSQQPCRRIYNCLPFYLRGI